MAIGTVNGFNPTKGCGFTLPDGGGSDAFMHATAVQRAGLSDLSDGQKVFYGFVADRRSGVIGEDRRTAGDRRRAAHRTIDRSTMS